MKRNVTTNRRINASNSYYMVRKRPMPGARRD